MRGVAPAAGAEHVGNTEVDGATLVEDILLHRQVHPVAGIHLGLQVKPRRPVLAAELDGPVLGQGHEGGELAAGLERLLVLVVEQGGTLDVVLVKVEADVDFPPVEYLPVDDELQTIVVTGTEVEARRSAVAVILGVVGLPPGVAIHAVGTPHETIAGNHVVGLAVVGRGEDVDLVETQVVAQLEGVGVLGVEVGVAEADLVALAHVHVGVEVPHVGAVHTAAVAELHALEVGDLVREVQRGIELPVGLVDGLGGGMVEVLAVDGRILSAQAGLQRELLHEVAAEGGVDGMDMLVVVEVGRRGGVVDMRGGRGGAVVVGLLVGPVHTAFVARLQAPAVVEGPQPVELQVGRLVVVLRLALAQVVVVSMGGGIAVDLLLLAIARHLAGTEGGVEGQLLVLAVELLGVKQVERMVEVDVVAAGGLVVVHRVGSVVHIAGVDVAMALAVAATQLVAEQQAVVVVEIVFAANLHASHVVGAEAVLVDVVVRASGAVEVEVLDIRGGVVAALAHAAVGVEEEVVLLGGIVEADVAHGGGDEARQRVGHHERQRGADVDVHHTVQTKGAGGLVLELDVDDAAHALGVVLGRGVGDDLHVLHRRGRYLLQQRRQVAAQQLAGASVDQHLDVARAAQRHIAVVVYRHAWHLLQHVGGRAAATHYILIHIDDALVQLVFHHRALGRHLDGLHQRAAHSQRHLSHIHIAVPVVQHHHIAMVVCIIAHERHPQNIAPVGGRQRETAVALAHRAVDQRRVAGPQQRHIGVLNVLARTGIHNLTSNSALLRHGSNAQNSKYQYNKSLHKSNNKTAKIRISREMAK